LEYNARVLFNGILTNIIGTCVWIIDHDNPSCFKTRLDNDNVPEFWYEGVYDSDNQKMCYENYGFRGRIDDTPNLVSSVIIKMDKYDKLSVIYGKHNNVYLEIELPKFL